MIVQHRPQAGSADLRREGQGRRAEAALRSTPRPTPARRRRARARRTARAREALEARVVDRTQLILDIFAQHARQRRGQAPGRAGADRVQPPRMRGHVEAPRATRGGRRHARTGRDAARDRPAAGAHRVWVLKRRLRELAGSARRGAGAASARMRRRSRSPGTRTSASRRCSTRSPARRSSVDEPALRDAGPDDARLRVRRPALSRHRHGRLHPAPAPPARRGLRGDARGDPRRRPRPPRRRRLRARGAASEMCTRSKGVLDEIGADELPGGDRAQQDRPRRSSWARRRLANRFPGALQSPQRPARGSTRSGRGSPSASRIASRTFGFSSRTPTGARSRRCTTSAHRSPSARYTRGRTRSGAAAPCGGCALRPISRRRRARAGRGNGAVIDIAVRRLRDDAHMPHQAYQGDAGFDLAACERVVLAPGERAMVATGMAVAIPEGYAGFVQPRSGLAARSMAFDGQLAGAHQPGYRGEISASELSGPASLVRRLRIARAGRPLKTLVRTVL